jgi:hypothetical protein
MPAQPQRCVLTFYHFSRLANSWFSSFRSHTHRSHYISQSHTYHTTTHHTTSHSHTHIHTHIHPHTPPHPHTHGYVPAPLLSLTSSLFLLLFLLLLCPLTPPLPHSPPPLSLSPSPIPFPQTHSLNPPCFSALYSARFACTALISLLLFSFIFRSLWSYGFTNMRDSPRPPIFIC